MNATKRSLILLALIVSSLLAAFPVQAQSEVELENVSAFYRFGEQITFVAQIKSPIQIQKASILIQSEASGVTQSQPLAIEADGHAEYRLDLSQTTLQPFSLVTWSYQFTLTDGTTFQSDSYFVHYDDNRFDWQTLESGPLRVHWYGSDEGFGQAALNATQSGLTSIGSLVTVDLNQPVDVFIYSNSDDLRGTLAAGGETWMAGHANATLGVVTVVIEPGQEQTIQMEQRISHELMHVMTYRLVGSGYKNVPAWLREGMATLAEVYPNPEYDRALLDASAKGQLIPLASLCESFPSDSGQAFLAYAESRSFVGYLEKSYGSSELSKLAVAYADGLDCEQGPVRSLGMSLASLEGKWHSSILGQNRFLPGLQAISPYLVLLCLVLIIPFIGIVMTLRKKGDPNAAGIHGKK